VSGDRVLRGIFGLEGGSGGRLEKIAHSGASRLVGLLFVRYN